MATGGCSTSTENSSEKQEIIKKANELLAQGKRNVVCGEVPKAIALYDEAVQMLAKEYGELSRNCVEAYFSYGSALLELGRMETNVLGVALEGVDVDAKEEEADSEQFEKPPAEDGEEREKLRTEVYEAMAEGDREKQMEAKEDANSDKIGLEDKKIEKEEPVESMETDKTEKLDKDTEIKAEEMNIEKTCDKDNKSTEKNSVNDDGDGRLDKDEPKYQEGKDEKVNETKRSKQEEDEGNTKIDDNESKDECNKDKEEEQKSDAKSEKEKESKQEMAMEIQKDENPKQKDTTNKDEPKIKESPVKILAEVNQEKQEEKQSKEANLTSSEEKENAPSCKDVGSEIKEKDDKTNTGSDKEKEKELDRKVIDKDKSDADVEMAENNDKEEDVDEEEKEAPEEEEEVPEKEEEVPEKEEEQEDDAEGDEKNGGESQEDEEKDEDVSNFQLAWEYLDLAKVIYLKSDTKEDQLKAAECHIKLGEVSMETEQHSTAADDLESALKIQQKHLAPDDRVIAETHYQLGLAYGLGKEFELSIQHYQQAVSVIEAKIASLSKLVEENEKDPENKENKEVDELQKYKDEIKELQELIPEMNNKIEDTKTEAKDMEKMKEMAKEMLGLSGTTKGFGSPTKKSEAANGSGSGNVDENGEKKASDISSLVRKKRKPEEEVSAESTTETKKIKQDDGAAATTNGVPEKEVNKDRKANGTGDMKVNGSGEIKANGDADTEMVPAS